MTGSHKVDFLCDLVLKGSHAREDLSQIEPNTGWNCLSGVLVYSFLDIVTFSIVTP